MNANLNALQKRNERYKPLKRSRYNSSSRQSEKIHHSFFLINFLNFSGTISLDVSVLPAKQGKAQPTEEKSTNTRRCELLTVKHIFSTTAKVKNHICLGSFYMRFVFNTFPTF